MKTSAELLSRREAAKRAGVHPNTILSWERRGLIKVRTVSIGGRRQLRIPAAEIDRVMDLQERAAARTEPANPPRAQRLRRWFGDEEKSVRAAAEKLAGDAVRQARRDRLVAERAARNEAVLLDRLNAERVTRESAEVRARQALHDLELARREVAQMRRAVAEREREIDGQARRAEKAHAEAMRRVEQVLADAERDKEAAQTIRAAAEAHQATARAESTRQRDETRVEAETLKDERDRLTAERAAFEAARRDIDRNEQEWRDHLIQLEQRVLEAERREAEAVERAGAEAAAAVAEAMLNAERQIEAIRRESAAQLERLREQPAPALDAEDPPTNQPGDDSVVPE